MVTGPGSTGGATGYVAYALAYPAFHALVSMYVRISRRKKKKQYLLEHLRAKRARL